MLDKEVETAISELQQPRHNSDVNRSRCAKVELAFPVAAGQDRMTSDVTIRRHNRTRTARREGSGPPPRVKTYSGSGHMETYPECLK